MVTSRGSRQVRVGGGVLDGQTRDEAGLVIENLRVLFGLVRVDDPGGLEGGEGGMIHVDLQNALGLHAQLRLHGGEILLHLEGDALAAGTGTPDGS